MTTDTRATPASPAPVSAEQLAAAARSDEGFGQCRAEADGAGRGHRATIPSLPLDPVEAQPRQVFFFDTPDLALDQRRTWRARAGSRAASATPW